MRTTHHPASSPLTPASEERPGTRTEKSPPATPARPAPNVLAAMRLLHDRTQKSQRFMSSDERAYVEHGRGSRE